MLIGLDEFHRLGVERQAGRVGDHEAAKLVDRLGELFVVEITVDDLVEHHPVAAIPEQELPHSVVFLGREVASRFGRNRLAGKDPVRFEVIQSGEDVAEGLDIVAELGIQVGSRNREERAVRRNECQTRASRGIGPVTGLGFRSEPGF